MKTTRGLIFNQDGLRNLTNVENGTGTKSLNQVQDETTGTFDFTNKNPNATAIDSTLTGQIAYGGQGAFATAFGGKSSAQGKRSFACGTTTIAKGAYSFASGDNSVALGPDSHAEGTMTTTVGYGAHAEGNNTIAGDGISKSQAAHAEGNGSKAYGLGAHAEGNSTLASGDNSHAEGDSSQARGKTSHAEGCQTTASGTASHASGFMTNAKGDYSFVAGKYCNTNREAQTVCGQFSVENSNSLFIVGVGTATNDRKNGFTVTSDGRAQVLSAPSFNSDVVRLKELKPFIFYNQLFFLNQVKLVTPTSTSIQMQILDTTGKVIDYTPPIDFSSVTKESTTQISFTASKVGFRLQNSDFSRISTVDLVYIWTMTYTPSTATTQPKFTFANPNLTATSASDFMVLNPSGYKTINSFFANICIIIPSSGNQTLIKIGDYGGKCLVFPCN